MEPLIELKNIEFGYTLENKIFDNLNFSLNKGEKIGLIGENGSGKTTLFHIIMGLLKPNNGEIFLFGKEMRTEDDFKKYRIKIGLLFQDSDDQLFSPTVLDDVAFGPLNLGFKSNEAKEIAENILKVLKIYHLKNKITYKLSGGEKRMVALATVLAMNPKVLLLDEPTNGIDKIHLELLINYLTKTNLSYIIISHDENFLEEVVTSKVYLENGKIIRD